MFTREELIAEADELNAKITALQNFICSNVFTSLEKDDIELMLMQLEFMRNYRAVLSLRARRSE